MATIRKIINKFGERVKKQWNMPLAIAEKEYSKMRAAVMPSLVAREYSDDGDWDGPDIDDFFLHSGWV